MVESPGYVTCDPRVCASGQILQLDARRKFHQSLWRPVSSLGQLLGGSIDAAIRSCTELVHFAV